MADGSHDASYGSGGSGTTHENIGRHGGVIVLTAAQIAAGAALVLSMPKFGALIATILRASSAARARSCTA